MCSTGHVVRPGENGEGLAFECDRVPRVSDVDGCEKVGAYIQNVIGSGLDKGTRGDVEVEALSHEMDPSGPEGTGVNKLN